MNDEIAVTLAGLTFSCRLRYPESARYFQKPDPGAPRVGTGSVSMSKEDWQFFVADGAEESPFSEYSLLCFNFSDALLPYDRVLVHGVALRWRDRAYLICADSGVGKSTQARCLRDLRPGEFSIICGDRPALEFRPCAPVGADAHIGPSASPACHSERSEESASPPCHSERGEESVSPVQSLPPRGKVSRPEAVTDEGPILVHPSPWNGKENWHGAPAAPLAGLILLERGEENRLVSLTDREAALPMYSHLIQTGCEPENIRRVAALETRLLQSVPIWKLTTFRVPDSTRLLLDAVFV